MTLSFPEYTQLVVECYRKKQAEGGLPPNLAQSTPTGIKDECIATFKKRLEKKDEGLLEAFFRSETTHRTLLQEIEHFDRDKFKPLDNYLKGLTQTTKPQNIELLAWLINFEHRPWTLGKEIPQVTKVPDDSKGDGNSQGGKTTGPDGPDKDKNEEGGKKDETRPTENKLETKKRRRTVAIFTLIGATMLGTGYYFLIGREQKQEIQGIMATGCMYWADTVYIQVPCDSHIAGREIIALNPFELKFQRKITNTDSITERSIGRMYYIQTNHNYEFFTVAGSYPLNRNRSLRKLSQRIFENHQKKVASAKAQ